MKLKKLKMPPKAEINTDELDMGPMGDMEGEMAGEKEGEMGESPEVPSSDMLADVSDDELLAELKKRGLMGKLEGEEEGEEEESEEDYMA